MAIICKIRDLGGHFQNGKYHEEENRMNKQKLLDELAMLASCLEDFKGTTGYCDGKYAAYEIAIELAKQLDEPQAEKVEVPDFVVEWLKTNEYSSDIYDLFQTVEYATDADGFIPENWKWCEELYDWISQDSDTLYILSDAIRYGYTVKPKRWVVKMATGYFMDFEEGCNEEGFEWVSSSKSCCLVFTDKAKAEAAATLVDGSVEEV